jgi:hypothetical protein
MNAMFARTVANAALALIIAGVVSLTPAAAGGGGGGRGGGGDGGGGGRGGGHGGYDPTPPSKVTGTSKPITCRAGGAGCMKQK